MSTKRGTYRFDYTGKDFSTWLDDRFGDACGVGLKGYILGLEGHGMIVLEGGPSDVDALADDIDNDSDTANFLSLLEENDVSHSYTEFVEFKESNICDSC